MTNQSGRFDHATAVLRVCVDSVEAERISGRVFSQRLTRPILFSDMGSLLLQIEPVLDAQNFPQAFQHARTFSTGVARGVPAAACPEEGLPLADVAEARGAVGTFRLAILTRRSSTWQGTVDWLDGGTAEPFESALELVKCTQRHGWTR